MAHSCPWQLRLSHIGRSSMSGCAQVCARSSKFALFDPAKEMAYIQMSRAEKSKGKAAVDLIGSQVGALSGRDGEVEANNPKDLSRATDWDNWLVLLCSLILGLATAVIRMVDAQIT